MKLEDVMLNEISQKAKVKCWMLTFLCGTFKMNTSDHIMHNKNKLLDSSYRNEFTKVVIRLMENIQ